MRLGIDASNIRAGGGGTHLAELLREAKPVEHGFSQVIVWSGRSTLDRLEYKPWLRKDLQPLLDKGLLCRTFWQRFRLSELARASGCDVLLVPGGIYTGDFYPIVTMSQNLLPFEWKELRRYGWSFRTLKLLILRVTQSRTFRRASGLVFLTHYARDIVVSATKGGFGHIAIIPHGINKRFVCPPREQKPISQYSEDSPYRIVYVSTINMYKHQWNVAQAIAKLKDSGLPVVLDLIGPHYPPALKRLNQTMHKIDPFGKYMNYLGPIPHEELHSHYVKADLCLFASSCENMPNILIEGMASGLPIACSNRGPMPEILGDGGVYFNPERTNEIANAVKVLIEDCGLRGRKSEIAFEKANAYTWNGCANRTFEFLNTVAGPHKSQPVSG